MLIAIAFFVQKMALDFPESTITFLFHEWDGICLFPTIIYSIHMHKQQIHWIHLSPEKKMKCHHTCFRVFHSITNTHNTHRGHFPGVNEQQACGRDDSHSVKSWHHLLWTLTTLDIWPCWSEGWKKMTKTGFINLWSD